MNKRMLWSRIRSIVGLAVMAIVLVVFGVNWQIGTFGWLSTVLLLAVFLLPVPVSGLVALGAFLGRSRYRRFMYCAFVLTLCGTIAVYLLIGNFEAPTVPWSEFVAVAYPVGAILSLVGALLVIVESFRGPPALPETVETA
ncbi:MAG: hypothetical protein NTZ77_03240 [Caldiserica bacterium]|nr:hypothetical protein [Caldisericota bacterium]